MNVGTLKIYHTLALYLPPQSLAVVAMLLSLLSSVVDL